MDESANLGNIEIDLDKRDAALARLRAQRTANGATPMEERRPRLKPYDLYDLLALDIPERKMIADPVIPEKGLVMLYAPRGVGKTHMVCGLSYAIATGTPFLKWSVPKARKVLHVDGEMPATDLRERFEQHMAAKAVKPTRGMLNILTANLIDLGIGNLASGKVRRNSNLGSKASSTSP